MKKILAFVIGAVLVLGVLAGCGSSDAPAAAEEPAAAAAPAAAEEPAAAPAASEVTWQDYIDWLADVIGSSSPDPDDFRALLAQASSWEDVDQSSPPWDKILGEDSYNASTWDEFVAAGGVGTYNTDFQDSAASGEASGEPTGEPAA